MHTEATAYVVDSDEAARDGIGTCLRQFGLRTELFDGPEALLANYDVTQPGCLVTELRFSGMTWCELRRQLSNLGCRRPFLIVTGAGTVADAVLAMRSGAVDFLEKPYLRMVLQERVRQAFDLDAAARKKHREQLATRTALATLSCREHEVLRLVANGKNTREMAKLLCLSPKTIEVHRSRIIGKMQVDSISELVVTLARLQIDLQVPDVCLKRA